MRLTPFFFIGLAFCLLGIGAVLYIAAASHNAVPGLQALFEVHASTGKVLRPTVLGASIVLASLFALLPIGILLAILGLKKNKPGGPLPGGGCGCGRSH